MANKLFDTDAQVRPRGNPALTSLVVSDKSGLPGEGFIGAADVPAEQASVFRFPWLESTPPSAEDLEVATREYPSNGQSLSQLKAKRAS